MTIERAAVEIRDQYGTVADVNVRERLIDLLVVPYNEETVIEYRGAPVLESVLPGAFAGLDAVPGRVALFRNHPAQGGRETGIARSVAESDSGLISTVYVSETPLGDETLILAADDVLRPSVGMGVRPKDQRWSDGNRRRQITRAFLDHIALVPQQAYLGARVLAVRSAIGGEPVEPPEIVATPRLDEVLAYTAGIDEMLRAARGA